MKILIIVHRFHPNLFFSIKSLIKNGNKVTMFVPEIRLYESLIEDHTYLEPIKIKTEKLTWTFIYRHIKDTNPDLIIQRHFKGKWKLYSVIGFSLGIKCITYDQSPHTSNNLFQQYLRPLKRIIKFQPLKKMTPVLNRGDIGKYVEPFSRYIPFPIETLVNSEDRLYMRNGKIRVLCVGKLGQRIKNHILLLDALEKINANCSLTFIGGNPDYKMSDKGYYAELERRCRTSKLKEEIKIIKDVPYREILQIYKHYDIFVLPSVREDYGQVIMEALASGCAVIASNNCGASGYITHKYNGLIFKTNDLDDLVDKLSFLLKNPSNISLLGLNALEYIGRQHSFDVYENLISDL